MTVSLTLLSRPSPIPSGSSYDVAWSPLGTHLAVASTSSPYLWLYRRVGLELVSVEVAQPPPRTVRSVEWSTDGQYLAVGTAQATGAYSLWLYGIDGLTIAKLGEYSYQSRVTAISWSPDSTYLATANLSADLVRVYKRTGDSLSLTQTLTTLPPFGPSDLSWSPDGTYLAISGEDSPFAVVYRRDGDVCTLLSTPAITPAYSSFALDWSYDSAYFAVATEGPGAATLCVYGHDGDTFFAEVEDYQVAAFSLGGLKWSDGAHVFAASAYADDFLFLFSLSGGALTEETSRSFFSPAIEQFIDWAPQANFLATASTSGFDWYQIDGVELPSSPLVGNLSVQDTCDTLDATGQIPLSIYGAIFEGADSWYAHGGTWAYIDAAPSGGSARYQLIMEGDTDLTLPISSFSLRHRTGSQSYLSVVVPAADAYRSEILARAGGRLRLVRIDYDADGVEIGTSPIIGVDMDSMRFHRGTRSVSAQIDGYAYSTTDESLIVPIEGVSCVSMHSGQAMLRAKTHGHLRPGHIATWTRDDGTIGRLLVDQIAHGANDQSETFDISGRIA